MVSMTEENKLVMFKVMCLRLGGVIWDGMKKYEAKLRS